MSDTWVDISHNLAVFPLSEVTLRDNSPSRAVMECTEIRETCETCETLNPGAPHWLRGTGWDPNLFHRPLVPRGRYSSH
jgi:hypothetical protein